MAHTVLKPPKTRRPAVALAGVAVVPGALTLYFAFQSGAYFPGPTAVGTLILIVLLIGRVLLADQPFAGLNVPVAIAAGALTLLAAWILVSAAWSDAPARAMTEFDRALLYLLAVVFFGSFTRDPRLVRWLVWGLATGMAALCIAALITRTVPDFWSAPAGLQRNRLSYPIGYWNALGVVASLGLVFCLHLACSVREPPAVRILAAAVMPALAATLYFTFSRGPIFIGAAALVAYVVVGRPRAMLTGLLAAAPFTAIAVAASYHADFLADFVKGRGYAPLTAQGLHQAHGVARTVALCALGAAVVRGLGVLLADDWIARFRMPKIAKRALVGAGALVCVLAIAVGAWAATRNGWIGRQYDRVLSDPVAQTGDYRDRLLNPGLNRLDRWRVAWHAFNDAPLQGQGAGTYRLYWERHRPTASDTENAHSLYLETLGELGVVGFALLAVLLLTIVAGLVARVRRPYRSVQAALLVGVLAWALNAAIDWDWEIPAVTFWVFAAGGIALAAPPGAGWERSLRGVTRAILALGLLLLAITPARLALSDRQLTKAVRTYQAGNCNVAFDAARSSASVLSVRPEPYQIESFCQSRNRKAGAAIAAMNEAISRDPKNWKYRYGLAVVRARAGVDPRPAARLAFRLNPREQDTQNGLRRFRGSTPAAWRREVRVLDRGR